MMKKLTAIALCLVLLCSICATQVFAEGFVFCETEQPTVEENMLIVKWNDTEVPQNAELQFDDAVFTVGDNSISRPITQDGSVLKVDVKTLGVGRYTVQYHYTLGTDECEVTSPYAFIKQGDLPVRLTITIGEGGRVIIKALDVNGTPVPNYNINVWVGSGSETGSTDEHGVYEAKIPATPGETVACEGKEVQTSADGNFTYLVAAKQQKVYEAPSTTTSSTTTTSTQDSTSSSEEESTTDPSNTTTIPSETTTTTVPTTQAVAATTVVYSTIYGASTTAKEDDLIAVNVTLDENILKLFGLSEANFNTQARLYLQPDDYNNLIGKNANCYLTLKLTTAAKAATAGDVAKAVANVSEFSAYDEDHRRMITFTLDFLLVDKTSGKEVPVTAIPLGAQYVIQLPLPKEMQKCEKWALTWFDGTDLVTPQAINNARNKCIRLSLSSLSTYTLIGFQNENTGASGGFSVILLVLLIVGIVLLAAAGFLVYWFVLRKTQPQPQPATETAAAYIPPMLDENDIYSGRSDYSEINRRPPSDTQ